MDGDDPLRQAEAHRYGRERRRLGAADGAVSLIVLVAITAAAGSLGGPGSLAALVVVPVLASLPFAYAGWRLSRAHGLSRQTAGGWLADRAKGLAVGLVLGGLAAAGVLVLQRASDDWWPLWVWAGGLLLSAALSLLFPVLLLPLFLKSEPLPDGPLADALRQTVRTAGIAVRELRVLHLGEKTSAGNAMVAGIGPTRRIYVGDTLSEDADEEERIVVTRDPVAAQRPAAVAPVDEQPLTVLADRDRNGLHRGEAVRRTVTGLDVDVAAPQAERAMVAVVRAGRVLGDVQAAVVAAERHAAPDGRLVERLLLLTLRGAPAGNPRRTLAFRAIGPRRARGVILPFGLSPTHRPVLGSEAWSLACGWVP